jgi:hypothetical protein
MKSDDIKMSKIDFTDKGKTEEICLYLIEREMDGKLYGGEIPCRNIKEARQVAKRIGFKVSGRVTHERENKVCSICSGDFPLVEKKAEPITDEWPDEVI